MESNSRGAVEEALAGYRFAEMSVRELALDADRLAVTLSSCTQVVAETLDMLGIEGTMAQDDFKRRIREYNKRCILLFEAHLRVVKIYLQMELPLPALQQMREYVRFAATTFPEFVSPVIYLSRIFKNQVPMIDEGLTDRQLFESLLIPIAKQINYKDYDVIGFNHHNSRLKNGLELFAVEPPEGGGSYLFWEWCSLQYLKFAELIDFYGGQHNLFPLPYPIVGSSVITSDECPGPNNQNFIEYMQITDISRYSNNSSNNKVNNNDTNLNNNIHDNDYNNNNIRNSIDNKIYSSNRNSTTNNDEPKYSSATNGIYFIQHPGYYYNIAYKMKKEEILRFNEFDLFLQFLTSIVKMKDSINDNNNIFNWKFIFLINMIINDTRYKHIKSLDLVSQSIDLLTRAYEQFKNHSSTRMTLILAYEIAKTYIETGKHEVAMKFFEKIINSFRKECWPQILSKVLLDSISCAQIVKGNDNLIINNSIELLSPLLSSNDYQMKLNSLNLINNTINNLQPINEYPFKSLNVVHQINMDDIIPFIKCSFQFNSLTTDLGNELDYQIHFILPDNKSLIAKSAESNDTKNNSISYNISYICITFSNSKYDTIYSCNSNCAYIDQDMDDSIKGRIIHSKNGIYLIDISDRKELIEDKLCFIPGTQISFMGTVCPQEAQILSIKQISLLYSNENTAKCIALNYNMDSRSLDSTLERKWIEETINEKNEIDLKVVKLDGVGELNKTNVVPPNPNIEITISHETDLIKSTRDINYFTTLLDSWIPIDININNKENIPVETFLDIDFRIPGTEDIDDLFSLVMCDEDFQNKEKIEKINDIYKKYQLNESKDLFIESLKEIKNITNRPTNDTNNEASSSKLISNEDLNKLKSLSRYVSLNEGQSLDIGIINPNEKLIKRIWLKCSCIESIRSLYYIIHYRPLPNIEFSPIKSTRQKQQNKTYTSYYNIQDKGLNIKDILHPRNNPTFYRSISNSINFSFERMININYHVSSISKNIISYEYDFTNKNYRKIDNPINDIKSGLSPTLVLDYIKLDKNNHFKINKFKREEKYLIKSILNIENIIDLNSIKLFSIGNDKNINNDIKVKCEFVDPNNNFSITNIVYDNKPIEELTLTTKIVKYFNPFDRYNKLLNRIIKLNIENEDTLIPIQEENLNKKESEFNKLLEFDILITIEMPIDCKIKDIDIGSLVFEWKSKNDNLKSNFGFVNNNVTSCYLPKWKNNIDEKSEIEITFNVPNIITYRKRFRVDYDIINFSNKLKRIFGVMDVGEGIVFGGQKQMYVKLPPYSKYKATYSFVALTTGKVKLPQLKVYEIENLSENKDISKDNNNNNNHTAVLEVTSAIAAYSGKGEEYGTEANAIDIEPTGHNNSIMIYDFMKGFHYILNEFLECKVQVPIRPTLANDHLTKYHQALNVHHEDPTSFQTKTTIQHGWLPISSFASALQCMDDELFVYPSHIV